MGIKGGNNMKLLGIKPTKTTSLIQMQRMAKNLKKLYLPSYVSLQITIWAGDKIRFWFSIENVIGKHLASWEEVNALYARLVKEAQNGTS